MPFWVKWALNWLVKRAKFRLYLSQDKVGRLFGGHDLTWITDTYVVLEISLVVRRGFGLLPSKTLIVFLGCWQTA